MLRRLLLLLPLVDGAPLAVGSCEYPSNGIVNPMRRKHNSDRMKHRRRLLETEVPKVLTPRVFLLNAEVLRANRNRTSLKPLAHPLEVLKKGADAALDFEPVSVITKLHPALSGDKHDYQSIGPYWWPNPKTKDGTPYRWLDGQINPDRAILGDSMKFETMIHKVHILATAYYFTQNETYAAHAAKLVKVWYLEPKTKMNPHLRYAQAIPGLCLGRGIGLIDSATQPNLIDAVGLLDGSPSWTHHDVAALQHWFDKFIDWMLTSRNGQDEEKERNNHGIQYDAQLISYALFVGKIDFARSILNATKDRRIAQQIRPDGTQPPELWRNTTWDYSCLATKFFTAVAELGARAQVDLWGYETSDGRSIRKALDYLLQYATGSKTWPHKQIRKFDPRRLLTSLLQAAQHDSSGRYAAAAQSIMRPRSVEHLLYTVPPTVKPKPTSSSSLTPPKKYRSFL